MHALLDREALMVKVALDVTPAAENNIRRVDRTDEATVNCDFFSNHIALDMRRLTKHE
jgi:hypothetical protein